MNDGAPPSLDKQTQPAGQGGPQFDTAPRSHRRAVPWSHRLGYLERKLNEGIAQGVASLGLTSSSRVLDFGCADQPYRKYLPEGATYGGADLPGNPAAEIFIQPDGRLPPAVGGFDAVLSTQVLEHVQDPAVYLAECFRVLAPGGRLLLSTHGIMVYHPDPVDYWRWTCAGLKHQVEAAGFRVVGISGVLGLAGTGLHLFQHAMLKRVPRLLRGLFTRMMQLLIRLVDRTDSPDSRALNALVFVVVAEKPVQSPPDRTDPRG